MRNRYLLHWLLQLTATATANPAVDFMSKDSSSGRWLLTPGQCSTLFVHLYLPSSKLSCVLYYMEYIFHTLHCMGNDRKLPCVVFVLETFRFLCPQTFWHWSNVANTFNSTQSSPFISPFALVFLCVVLSLCCGYFKLSISLYRLWASQK